MSLWVLGTRAALRRWRAGDEADLHREIRDPEIVRWLDIQLPYTREDAARFIVRTATDWDSQRAFHFVVTDGRARFAGYLGILTTVEQGHEWELVYWLAARMRGRGLATDAVAAALAWVDATLGPNKVTIGMVAGNRASARVAAANGFELARVAVGAAVVDGGAADEEIHRRRDDAAARDDVIVVDRPDVEELIAQRGLKVARRLVGGRG